VVENITVYTLTTLKKGEGCFTAFNRQGSSRDAMKKYPKAASEITEMSALQNLNKILNRT
jgi:hypothetical protein